MEFENRVTVFIVKGTTLKTCPELKSVPFKPSTEYIFTRESGKINTVGIHTEESLIYTMDDNTLDKVIDRINKNKGTRKTQIFYASTPLSESFNNYNLNMTTLIDVYLPFFEELKQKRLYYSITKKMIIQIFNKIGNKEWYFNSDSIIIEFLDKDILKKYGSGFALTDDAKKYIGAKKIKSDVAELTAAAISERKTRLRTRTPEEKAEYDKKLLAENIADSKEGK
jgi:hypothetical protein